MQCTILIHYLNIGRQLCTLPFQTIQAQIAKKLLVITTVYKKKKLSLNEILNT